MGNDWVLTNLEWLAVLLGVANITLLIRRSIWNYPFGIVMVSIYGYIFYQSKLYSEAGLQVFFLVVQMYGWINWHKVKEQAGEIDVGWSPRGFILACIGATAVIALLVGNLMDRMTDAAAPYHDAAIAIMSVTAQILMVMRRVESWVYWIVVDILAVWLFYTRDLLPTSGLYAVFLVLATIGLFQWVRASSSKATTKASEAQS